jgi:anthranilate synthase
MEDSYTTQGGITITRTVQPLPYGSALEVPLSAIDRHRGAIFASDYDYPGRYSRWDIAFVDPPLQILGYGQGFHIDALNERGDQLITMISKALSKNDHLQNLEVSEHQISGGLKKGGSLFREEDRSKQPTFFSVLRTIVDLFSSEVDPHLGLYGAFGYDLVFQFEPIRLHHARDPRATIGHVYLPDELIIVDHRKEAAEVRHYDFSADDADTTGLARTGSEVALKRGVRPSVVSDHAPGEYAAKVREAHEDFRRGDLFEVILSQVFSTDYLGTPRELFDAIRATNPSPYEFLINLGDEQLVGASPEMFVRVEGDRVEGCPISGTIARGRDAMEDYEQILALLNSKKDESELTMCTDVDRNDKSRVCKPGTVRLVGRRLIEIYSRLIHTVDYVVGTLRDDCDAFDALLSHMWACTLTGAPKPAAMQRIEALEKSPRQWYGGAVGFVTFNGDLNTGVTIRTVQLKDGVARVRVGTTLLMDSDPDAEERETRTKASAFLDAVLGKRKETYVGFVPDPLPGKAPRVLFVDNRDSFVHTLANYVRQTGAEVSTLRAGFSVDILDAEKPDLVFISPGPGTPEEFGVPDLVRACVARGIPVFGVCLGLQGMVQAFGGSLRVLDYPMHGKPSTIINSQTGLFEGFPKTFTAGRYHSLYANPQDLPSCLNVTAHSDDGVIMAIEHATIPAAAVQFHPESIMTLKDTLGLKLISNVIRTLAVREERPSQEMSAPLLQRGAR